VTWTDHRAAQGARAEEDARGACGAAVYFKLYELQYRDQEPLVASAPRPAAACGRVEWFRARAGGGDPMCVLTRDVILREIRDGNIVIDPFDESMVGPGSVDLHLSNEIREFPPKSELYHVTDDPDVEAVTVRRLVEDYFVLQPGDDPRDHAGGSGCGNICGRLEGGRRFAPGS
jgi:hypothetical protein